MRINLDQHFVHPCCSSAELPLSHPSVLTFCASLLAADERGGLNLCVSNQRVLIALQCFAWGAGFMSRSRALVQYIQHNRPLSQRWTRERNSLQIDARREWRRTKKQTKAQLSILLYATLHEIPVLWVVDRCELRLSYPDP